MQLYNVVKRVRVMCKRVRLADCIATIFFLASLYNQSKNENELLHGIWMFIKKTQIRMSTFLFLFFVSNFFSLLLSEINSGNLHFNVISMNVTRSSMVKFNDHRHSFETHGHGMTLWRSSSKTKRIEIVSGSGWEERRIQWTITAKYNLKYSRKQIHFNSW